MFGRTNQTSSLAAAVHVGEAGGVIVRKPSDVHADVVVIVATSTTEPQKRPQNLRNGHRTSETATEPQKRPIGEYSRLACVAHTRWNGRIDGGKERNGTESGGESDARQETGERMGRTLWRKEEIRRETRGEERNEIEEER